jgi:hypothetical protein
LLAETHLPCVDRPTIVFCPTRRAFDLSLLAAHARPSAFSRFSTTRLLRLSAGCSSLATALIQPGVFFFFLFPFTPALLLGLVSLSFASALPYRRAHRFSNHLSQLSLSTPHHRCAVTETQSPFVAGLTRSRRVAVPQVPLSATSALFPP